MGKMTALKAFLLSSSAAVMLWSYAVSPLGGWPGKATFLYAVAAFWAGLVVETTAERDARLHDRMVQELVKQPWYRFAQNDRDN